MGEIALQDCIGGTRIIKSYPYTSRNLWAFMACPRLRWLSVAARQGRS